MEGGGWSMYIHEAVEKSLKSGAAITRAKAWWGYQVGIIPTNGDGCCIAVMMEGTEIKNPCRGWQPVAEDLMAEDWVLAGSE